MFILNAADVEFCYVTYSKTDLAKILPGVNYRGYLFVKAYNHAREKFKKAILQSREFLDQKIPVVSIVVREEESISVWIHNEQLELVTESNVTHYPAPEKASEGKKVGINPGDRIHLPLNGENYEVLENDGLFVKTKNLNTGFISTFSLVEVTYQLKLGTKAD